MTASAEIDGRCLGHLSRYVTSHPGPTPPGHPFVGRRNEYQPKGGDALRLGSKGTRQVWLVCAWQVKLCDHLVTHGPYLSALEIHVGHYKALYKFVFFTFTFSVDEIFSKAEESNTSCFLSDVTDCNRNSAIKILFA